MFERARDIKLVITDMDGTLLHSDKSVSDYTLDVIKRIRQKGIEFTICTGRSYAWLGDYVPHLGITCPLIGSNGCEIVDGGTGESLYTASLGFENAAKAIGYCMDYKLDFFCETPDGWIIPNYISNMDPFPGFYPDLPLNGFSMDKTIRVKDKSQLERLTVFKVVVWITYGNEGELMRELASQMTGVELLHSARDIYEILPENNNKGKSFLKLCDIMGIAPSECCALGDFDNDLPMLKAAGISVAVANAPSRIRDAVDYVTDTNNNDGVAKALNKIFLN